MDNSESYNIFFEGSPIPMWISDPDLGSFLDVNKAALKIFGLSRSTFFKKNPADLITAGHSSDYSILRNSNGESFNVILKSQKILYKKKNAILSIVKWSSAEQSGSGNSEEELKNIILTGNAALKAAETAKDKLAFLAEASEILSSSLDYQETLKSVSRLATPRLSDWCVVDILDTNEKLKRIAVSHINPDKVELAAEMHRKYGASPNEAGGVYNVIRTGISELYPEISEELLRASTRDEEHLKASLELGLKSGMIVPLKVHDQVFGAISLIYAESGRKYNEADLRLVEDLAARAAMAIDNARLYERARLLNAELDKKIVDLENEIYNRKQIEDILIDNQEKLILSEERLKAALSASETGTYRWNIDTNSLYFDDGFLKIFGLPLGTNISYVEFINRAHLEDRDLILNAIESSIANNHDFNLEYRTVWDDGSVHWVLDKGKVFSLEDGKPLYLTGACIDITFRKHVEQTLRDNEILFRQIAENIRDVFFIVNPVNRHLIYLSPIFEEISGIKREDIYRNPDSYFLIVHPDDREYYIKQINAGMKTGRFMLEHRIIRPDNNIRWLRTRGFPLFNTSGDLIRVTGITEDITERKAAEEELHKNQELLRSTVTSAPVILWAVNQSYNITLLEGRGLEKIGLKPEGYIGKNIFTLFKESIEFKNHLSEALNGEEVSFILKESGTWQELRYSPLKDNAGNINGVIGVSLDITEHKMAEEKIITSLKEKEILLKEIHHRVKNNLQIISSILSLQSGYIDDKTMQHILEESRNRVRSMALLHEKLYQTKDFSRISLKNYAEDLSKYLFSSYHTESGTVSFNIYGNDIFIDAEKAIPIGLIINELISNSLKHAFKGVEKGEIQIKLEKTENDCLKLNISDNGNGLPEGFDISNMGTLGLQIVNSLVEQLEGKINVYNLNGANFELSLPEITSG